MIYTTKITKYYNSGYHLTKDFLAIEEPLEIRIRHGEGINRKEESLTVTMRSPGDDFDLVAGWLFAEGIVPDFKMIQNIRYCSGTKTKKDEGNVVKVELYPKLMIDFELIKRHIYTSSACGVCGKTSIQSLNIKRKSRLNVAKPTVFNKIFYDLPATLRAAQEDFKSTGGLHAAALFDTKGNLILMREDIGRHNAVDKVIGAAFYKKLFPLHNYILMVSGRVGFELVQKALQANIPIMAAIGAPSSLAVQTAQEYNMTLIGFLKNERFNIYNDNNRLKNVQDE